MDSVNDERHSEHDGGGQPSTATMVGVVQQHPQQQQQQRLEEELEQERVRVQREWELCDHDPYKGSPQSKYPRYSCTVDHEEGDRATQIKLCSAARPHSRALHCAWISFFLAFTIWFAPAPLLKEIQTSLGLSKKEIWTSSITNDCTAIVMRLIMGPVCDRFGARLPMAAVLIIASIPTACVGLVNSAMGLSLVRFFIGIAGSSFVMAQFWPSRMFSREIAGTANGLVGGWGNLGGAWTQLMMGRMLFPAFRDNFFDGDPEKAWRVICVIPAGIAFLFGCVMPFISDDAPMGNYVEMKKQGAMDQIYMTTSLRSGATRNTWILYAQYACSFGVEIVMNNAAVLYYSSEFDLTTEEASTLGFIYGSMNIFARALGGLTSDKLNLKVGMRGRLWWTTILLLLEGCLILVFAFTKTLVGAIIVMCVFSIFTQAAEGAIYGIVPYVSKLYTGSVAGFVGSGGNMGSVVYGIFFRSMPYRDAFCLMGSIVMASSFLSIFINIPCHAGLICGEDNHAVIQARERFIERHAYEVEHSQRRRNLDISHEEESRQGEEGERVYTATAPDEGSENGHPDEEEVKEEETEMVDVRV